jgi:hypothetical protein
LVVPAKVFRAPQEEGLQQVANLFDELGSEVGETRGNRFHVLLDRLKTECSY